MTDVPGSNERSTENGAERRRRAHGRYADGMYEAIGRLDPDMQRWSDGFIFGDVWGRPGLTHEERTLVVIVALATNGNLEQLRYYIAGALEAGMESERIHESLITLVVYVGFPAALSAIAVLNKVLSDRDKHSA